MRGEVISGPGNFEIEVLDADPRRVKRLRVGPRKERPAPRPARPRRRDTTSDTGAAPSNDNVNTPPSGDNAARRDITQPALDRTQHHSRMGLEARSASRLLAGAVSALAMAPFNAWPVLFITFPVAGLADRWRRRRQRCAAFRPPATGRLVVRFRLFRRRPVLDRLRFPWSTRRPSRGCCRSPCCGLPAYLALFTALGFALARLIWTHGCRRASSALAVGADRRQNGCAAMC